MTQPPALDSYVSSSYKLSAFFLAILFITEIAIFYWTVIWHIVPFYPINSDQTSYYLDTYTIIQKGWSALLDEYVDGAHATGVSFTAAGAIFGLIFGSSRTVIISLNLVSLLALQFVQFHVILARTNNLVFAWLSVALLLSAQTLFNDAGGIFDYRIDFTAFCLYGMWVCSILWSDIFRYFGRSLIVAAVGILLVSFRYLTALYVASSLGALLIIFVWSTLKSASIVEREIARHRVRNIFVAAIIMALIIGPLLFSSRLQIYNYYVVGHVIGEERYIRAHMLGLFTIIDHLLYYPRSIYKEHLGVLSVALFVFISFVAAAFHRSPLPRMVLTHRLKRYGLDLTVLGCSSIFPTVALTADIAKSSVVGGIIVVPIILISTLFVAIIWQGRVLAGQEYSETRPLPFPIRFAKQSGLSLRHVGVIAAVLVGLGCFSTRGLTPPDGRPVPDLLRITEINEVIDRYLIQTPLAHPSISIDRVTDYLNLGTVILFGFEKYHRLISLSPNFGHSIYGIFEVPRETALKLFLDSDVIVLTDPVRGRTGYPTDKKIIEYWNEVRDWTRQNRTLIYSANIFGVPHDVYVRDTNLNN